MKKHLSVMLLLVLVMTLLSGCRYLMPREVERQEPPLVKPTEITFDLYEVKRANVDSGIKSSVQVDYTKESLVAVNFGAFRPATLKAGMKIEKGQVIAEYYPMIFGNDPYVQKLHQYIDLVYRDYQNRQNNTNDAALTDNISKKEEELKELMGDQKVQQVKAPFTGILIQALTNDMYESPSGKWGSDFNFATLGDDTKMLISYSGRDIEMLKQGMGVQLVSDENTYDVVVDIDKSNPGRAYLNFADQEKKRPVFGEQLTLYYSTEKHENVLVIPVNLVKTYMGKNFVEILTPDQKKQERIIETGLKDASGAYIEIVSGLNEGDKVIIR